MKKAKNRTVGKKERSTISLILGVIIMVSLSAVAYAYFTAQITNNSTKQVTVTAKSMKLTFSDNDATVGDVTGSLNFGESIEKKFTIQNTGDMDTYARIMWKDMINTYIYRDLKYTLSYSDEENGEYTNLTYNRHVRKGYEP